MKNFGYFKPTDPTLDGLRFGNWGSRPYEYYWAATILDAKDKTVLDLGIGSPSEHNWYDFVTNVMKTKLYCGIDFDERLKTETIDTDNCKVQWMDMTDLKFDNDKFDIVYCISTFEHFEKEELFLESIKEAHRVCKKDGLMVVTLDELWNKDNKDPIYSAWNELEKILIKNNHYDNSNISFGMKDFINLVSNYFEPLEFKTTEIEKANSDESLLHSKIWNSVVSYGIFKVKK